MKFDLVILTFNEEVHIKRCIESVLPVINQIFIIDSGSSDDTLKMAKEYNSVILSNKFVDHPKQWKYAIESINSNSEWLICIDADQYFPEESLTVLRKLSSEELAGLEGLYINRKYIFRGREIKYGGYFPKYMLKIVRNGCVSSSLNERLDHRFVVNGKCKVIKELILKEHNLKEDEINFWLEKHIKYAKLVALNEMERYYSKYLYDGNMNTPDASIIFRKNIWIKLPLYYRSVLYFIYRFFVKLGFLDGREGRLFHFLHSLWFRLLVDHMIYDLRRKKC